MTDRRAFPLNDRPAGTGPVYCWLSRDPRLEDNWAVLHAQREALARRVPLSIVFCLTDAFPGATRRAYDFLVRGLSELAADCRRHRIGFLLLRGDPAAKLPALLARHPGSLLITDFSPLHLGRQWRDEVAAAIGVAAIEVDAHNVVPCRVASPKVEFAARTIRPKIHRLLPEFLVPFPEVVTMPQASADGTVGVASDGTAPDWEALCAAPPGDPSVGPVSSFVPGAAAGRKALARFLKDRLAAYPDARNDPNLAGTSDLSPYLHFGQLSPQRVALEVLRAAAPEEAKAALIEELIVRRELSDNRCLYQKLYDSPEGFPDWARKTLHEHRTDPRPYLYSRKDFDRAATHDDLWNAAQRQMVETGKMHGYLRMYWAKKILEWSATPEEAFHTALALNDRYELDGRDPNGYVGVAWSIGGVHDRAWPSRPVFGKIRCMTASGCRGKFDVRAFTARWSVR